MYGAVEINKRISSWRENPMVMYTTQVGLWRSLKYSLFMLYAWSIHDLSKGTWRLNGRCWKMNYQFHMQPCYLLYGGLIQCPVTLPRVNKEIKWERQTTGKVSWWEICNQPASISLLYWKNIFKWIERIQDKEESKDKNETKRIETELKRFTAVRP